MVDSQMLTSAKVREAFGRLDIPLGCIVTSALPETLSQQHMLVVRVAVQ